MKRINEPKKFYIVTTPFDKIVLEADHGHSAVQAVVRQSTNLKPGDQITVHAKLRHSNVLVGEYEVEESDIEKMIE